ASAHPNTAIKEETKKKISTAGTKLVTRKPRASTPAGRAHFKFPGADRAHSASSSSTQAEKMYVSGMEPKNRCAADAPITPARSAAVRRDRKSTRLNSSHGSISYAVYCLK